MALRLSRRTFLKRAAAQLVWRAVKPKVKPVAIKAGLKLGRYALRRLTGF